MRSRIAMEGKITVCRRIQRCIRIVTPPPGSLIESTVDIVHKLAHFSARCTCLSGSLDFGLYKREKDVNGRNRHLI